MPQRPALKNSYFTKNRFQRHSFCSSELSQLLPAVFHLLITKNMYWPLWRRWEEPRLNSRLWLSVTCCGHVICVRHANIHVRYKCSFHWRAAIRRWATCSLHCTYLWIWAAIFAPVPTYELEQPSPFDFTGQIGQIQKDHISRAAVYLQLGLCKYNVALLPPTRPP